MSPAPSDYCGNGDYQSPEDYGYTVQVHDPAGPDLDFDARDLAEAYRVAEAETPAGAFYRIVGPDGRILEERGR